VKTSEGEINVKNENIIKMKFQIVDRGGNGLLLRNLDADGKVSEEYYFDLKHE